MPCAFCGARIRWTNSHSLAGNTGRICGPCNGRFQGVNLNPNAIGYTPLEGNPAILLAGVFQNFQFSGAEVNAIVAASNQAAGNAENIWGLGFAASHHTIPHSNIVVVYTRQGGQAGGITVYAMGRHTGRHGNDEYHILRSNGRAIRATR